VIKNAQESASFKNIFRIPQPTYVPNLSQPAENHMVRNLACGAGTQDVAKRQRGNAMANQHGLSRDKVECNQAASTICRLKAEAQTLA